MNYQALARKWRPQTFDDYVGQEATTVALTNAIINNTIHHAYLFTGTRGVGKTSIARIFAKCLSCETGVTTTPCGKCSSCVDIARGVYPDVIEIDGASKTKVEDTRDLIDSVGYAPYIGRYKIYIIDEVHMLSNHSFNALLKTIEEPPEHVKFLLATTEPQKLPATILSRCLQFNLLGFNSNQIEKHLIHVLTEENIKFEKEAVTKISVAAKSSMRDALTLLEQSIAIGENNVSTVVVNKLLGVTQSDWVVELFENIIHSKTENAINLIAKLSGEQGIHDFENILKLFQSLLHKISITQALGELSFNIPSEFSQEKLNELAVNIEPEILQLYYDMSLQAMRSLPYAPESRIGFEMMVLRMICFRNVDINLQEQSAIKVAPEPKVVLKPTLGKAIVSNVASDITPDIIPVETIETVDTKSSNWAEIINKLDISGLTKMIAKSCVISNWSDTVVELKLAESKKPLLNDKNKQKLEDALIKYLGKTIKVLIATDEVVDNTPQQHDNKIAEQKNSDARDSIINNSTVKEILATFDGRIKNIETNEV